MDPFDNLIDLTCYYFILNVLKDLFLTKKQYILKGSDVPRLNGTGLICPLLNGSDRVASLMGQLLKTPY